jgi:uncharacterized membrane protein YccC
VLAGLAVAAGASWYAIGRHPYSEYAFLHLVIFATAGGAAWLIFERQRTVAILIGIVALAFNPFIRVHMRRAGWEQLDTTASVAFAIAAVYLISFQWTVRSGKIERR